jgi:hypothetical protein
MGQREQPEAVQSGRRLELVEVHPNVYEHFPPLDSGHFRSQTDFHLKEIHREPLDLGLAENRFSICS